MTVRRITLLLAAIAGTVILAYELRVHVFLRDHSFPELIELAPAHSTFIAYIDLAELRKEPLIGHLAALAEPVTVDPDYKQFISSTGFDYQRDLDQVAITATADEKVAIADGRFDRKKIEEYALRSGAIEKRNGHTVYVMSSKMRGQAISLTFLGAHRIVLSEGGDFIGYLTSPRAPLDPAMRQRLSRVAGSPAFAGWKIPDSLTHAAGRAGSFAVPALQSLRAINLAIKPEAQQLLISVEGECDDSLQAQNLSASLEFLRTILPVGLTGPLTGAKKRGQMSAENAALAARLVEATEITTNNDRVRLLLTVSPDMIGGSAPTK
jgi:hypothetical protein